MEKIMINVANYSADKAECLLNIINYGVYSHLTCLNCRYKGDTDCPFYDVQKAKEEIHMFITRKRYFDGEGFEYVED